MSRAAFARDLEKTILNLAKNSKDSVPILTQLFVNCAVFVNHNAKNKTFTVSIKNFKLIGEDLNVIKSVLEKEYGDNFIRIINTKIVNPGMWNHGNPKVVITFKDAVC